MACAAVRRSSYQCPKMVATTITPVSAKASARAMKILFIGRQCRRGQFKVGGGNQRRLPIRHSIRA